LILRDSCGRLPPTESLIASHRDSERIDAGDDRAYHSDMSALTIDTLEGAQILRKHGFTEEQAIGVVEALREIDASELATRADLKEAVADLKVDMVRRLVVTQIALAGVVLAAVKFIH
jgi:hypothetical protein